ncbi:MAG TPA: protein-glutamate O-methyltransferase CheR [Spirochaetales bacterium]|nr:protein-glutamate O-methyltransferase CheR [Spirochaetales bacterium]HPM72360.1 protein-glutamate O-methyltransferase CheR [Spirochaetales bacterium]
MHDRSSIAPLSDSEFRKIASFIEQEFGIRMPEAKKALLQGRLHKRLVACGKRSYGEYFGFVTEDPAGKDEFLVFTDLVSTHETSFFREPGHFKHLRQILPDLAAERSRLRFLCAACSTGEEAYSLAMTIDETLSEAGLGRVPFTIEGFDLSSHAVEAARRGVFSEARAKKIPAEMTKRYMMRSKNPVKEVRRAVPELRARMLFHTGNLLDDMGLAERRYDVIFCRNVLIYFDRRNQQKVVAALASRLSDEGYLYLGHSETISNLDLPLRTIGHAVYQLR